MNQNQLRAVAPEKEWNTKKNLPVSRRKTIVTRESKGRIAQVFFNVDLRCAHLGLSLIAKKASIDVTKIEPGNYLIFLNSAKTKFKMYAANNVVAYYSSTTGRIDLTAIQYIPAAFSNGTTLDFDKATKIALERHFARKGRVVIVKKAA